jgi:hypothetical protein
MYDTYDARNSVSHFEAENHQAITFDSDFKKFKFDKTNEENDLPKQSDEMIQANEDHVVHSLQSLKYLNDHKDGKK